jgi:uncharacterized cupin superfamily protein
MPYVRLSDHPVVPGSFARMQALNDALGIEAFGLNAVVMDPGEEADTDHTETDERQQEAYVVVAGHARFRVGEEEIDAPAGTVVSAPDPGAVRGYEALEPGTRIVCIGAPVSERHPDYGAWIGEG